MTARFLVGDVFDRMAELEDGTYDLVITSPPFLALRSYLPDGHPDKAKEIGSEATPAAFLDVMLALTAEWGRLLAPHGSIAIEIGDTYSGSGGAGGDYNDGGWREAQQAFAGSAKQARVNDPNGMPPHRHRSKSGGNGGDGWPMAKSLAMIPELYAASLAYGRNLLTGQPSPAGRWRVRNFKPWIRSNPPVGALGDKERPATSYVTVACRATDRYFDLDAVRTGLLPGSEKPRSYKVGSKTDQEHGQATVNNSNGQMSNPAGAPPLDWWHHIDAIIDAELDRRAGVRGVHMRRALENAGILATLDALDVSPKGYAGSHYAVWPMELVKLLVQEMAPRRVCTTCGQPSRRIVEATYEAHSPDTIEQQHAMPRGRAAEGTSILGVDASFKHGRATKHVTTTGWSDCGHHTWRPARILDPFAGSGTTLAVATGLGHHADGIDLDDRNADLAQERCGMFLTVDHPTSKDVA